MKLRALFITRNYPPKLGGLEVYSYNLIKEFETHDITYKIVSTKSYLHLSWFLPYCLFKGLYVTWRHGVRSIHLCDGLLAPIGVLLKLLTQAKVSIGIVGLDITYRNSLYQLIIPWCVGRLDRVVCISRSTRDECIRRGIPFHKCTVIPVGIRHNELYLPYPRDDLRRRLERIAGMSLQNKIVLVTVGRLVKRKGVAWFIENVMPRLTTSYHYLIVGDGPEYKHIQQVMRRHKLQNRVLMLGKLSDEKKSIVYNASDVFIMPNITIAGDFEGFGIVIIEAGSCGLPVIASNLQGIKDAVIDRKTGYLVDERDADGFIAKIEEMNLDREEIRAVVNKTFDWAQIYKQYRRVLTETGIGNIADR